MPDTQEYVLRCTVCGRVALGVAKQRLDSIYLLPCNNNRLMSELVAVDRYIKATDPHPRSDLVRYERRYHVERCNGQMEYVPYDRENRTLTSEEK